MVTRLRAGDRPVGRAATGAGKSLLLAALAHVVGTSPVVRRRGDVVVISTPTEGLVAQLHATIAEHVGPASPAGLTVGRYYGRAKDPRADVVVACGASLVALADELRGIGRRPALLLLDECHLRPLTAALREALDARATAGVTATPWRADTPMGGFTAPLAFDYGISQAITDGAIVRPEVRYWWGDRETDVNVSTIAMLDRWVPRAGAPTVVSAEDIDDAEAFALVLAANGRPAAALHSKVPARERARRVEALRRGELSAIVHVRMLVEGADYRWLRALVLRVRRNARGLVQEVGRVLRTDEAKDYGLVLDPLMQIPIGADAMMGALGPEARLAIDDLEQKAAAEAAAELGEREALPRVLALAVPVPDAEAWAIRLRDAAARVGLAVGGLSGRSGEPASPAQAARLAEWAGAGRSPLSALPSEARAVALRLIEAGPSTRTAGAILDAAGAAHRRWVETAKAAGGGRPAWERGWRWPTRDDVGL